MTFTRDKPLRILTPRRYIKSENWPGQTPVEILHMADIYDASPFHLGVDVLLAQVFTKEMAHAADSLRLIQATGTGIERIDLSVVPPGCQVATVYEHENAIAEWVIMAMIALNRDTIRAHNDVRDATWKMHVTRGAPPRHELRSQTLGIVGLGHIGRRTAELARAFGMRLVAATRTVPPDEERLRLGLDFTTDMMGLDRVLGDSDFILLSLPQTQETQGLIGVDELAKMKPEAHLINVSRAGLVDEKALFDALKSKQIKGAALDVWFQEPTGPDDFPKPSQYPFWELDNVLMSPHSATITHEMRDRRLEFAAANIDRFARGEPLENVVYTG